MITTYIRTAAKAIKVALALTIALTIVAPTTGFTANGLSTTVNFDIAPQPLSGALLKYSQQSGVQVTSSAKLLDGLMSRGIVGPLTADSALQQLLNGTSLSYAAVDERTVTIFSKKPQPSQRISAADAADGGPALRVVRTEQSKTQLQEVGESGATSAAKAATDNKIEEIVVTAQKRQERLIDVPMSITAISGEKLVAAGIENVRDLSFVVPSLAVSETTPGQQIVVIRGIGSQRGTSSLTGIYLDEMPVTGAKGAGSSAVATDIRAIDLNRVEVLKGPQGTLFGEGAAGGVVRFITNDPDLSRAGASIATNVSSTADGGWNEDFTGVLNLPVVDGVFGVRIAASYENESGWIDQPSMGREDINDSEVKHARVKLLYAPTPQLKIKGLAEIHRNQGGASNFVNQQPFSQSNFRQAVDPAIPTDFTDEYDAFNLAVTYDFGFAELLSSTSYLDVEGTSTFTQLVNGDPGETRPYLEIVAAASSLSTIKAQELRLTSTTAGPISWSVGASYKDNDFSAPSREISGRPGVAGLAIVNIPGLPPYLLLAPFPLTKPGVTSESWATFANAAYKFAGRFELGGGLRYFADKRTAFEATTPSAGVLEGDFHKLTFRTYAKYQATEAMNLYLNVASGFRSGAPNGLRYISLGAPPSYGVEETLFYEAGAKMELLDGRLRLATAVFFGEYQGMQEDILRISPVDFVTPIQYTSNGQDAEIRGVELEIAWLPFDGLTLSLAGDVNDTEITFIDPANQTPAFRVGDPVNFAPKYGVSAGADYRFQWSGSVPGFVTLSFDQQGKSYMTARANGLLRARETSRQTSSSELSFLNASVGGEWNGWNVKLFGRNLLDESGLTNAAVEGWTAQARPRTVGVGFSKSF